VLGADGDRRGRDIAVFQGLGRGPLRAEDGHVRIPLPFDFEVRRSWLSSKGAPLTLPATPIILTLN